MAMRIKTIQKHKLFPEHYTPKLDYWRTQKAIQLIKSEFPKALSKQLNLIRVSAAKFLKKGTGLQDDLAGLQEPVGFRTKDGDEVEIVHSLAKWKRYTLGKYEFKTGSGLYTDMDAIRKDEETSPIHSIYVDQWDWEKVISPRAKSLSYLKDTARSIYSSMKETEKAVASKFPELKPALPEDIAFIHSEDLLEMYPDKSPKEREKLIAKEYGAVFIIGIGHSLRDGKPHDLRAADYDDWSSITSRRTRGLNGDIIVWDRVREDALEISSMGIRVGKTALKAQARLMAQEQILSQPFQRSILSGELPQSIGGGIGQSRLCMLLLQKAHIGEVQSSVWPQDVEEEFEERGVALL